MSHDDPPPESSQHNAQANSVQTTRRNVGSFFRVPAPVKHIFDQFPLITYAPNEAPLRAPKATGKHVLHIFATKENAQRGRPSFNPTCLKWQAYLKIAGIGHNVVPSSNHASPTGSLPFLLPANVKQESTTSPVPSNKLKRWIRENKSVEQLQESHDVRSEALMSLLDNAIRKAWLYQLYLDPTNASLVHDLYIRACSSNSLVEMAIAYQLRAAAEHELVKTSSANIIVEADVYQEAKDAWTALSTALGSDQCFFGGESPGLFDASIFAYTHLLLDEQMKWADNKLAEMLREHDNLVQHRLRILEAYF